MVVSTPKVFLSTIKSQVSEIRCLDSSLDEPIWKNLPLIRHLEKPNELTYRAGSLEIKL